MSSPIYIKVNVWNPMWKHGGRNIGVAPYGYRSSSTVDNLISKLERAASYYDSEITKDHLNDPAPYEIFPYPLIVPDFEYMGMKFHYCGHWDLDWDETGEKEEYFSEWLKLLKSPGIGENSPIKKSWFTGRRGMRFIATSKEDMEKFMCCDSVKKNDVDALCDGKYEEMVPEAFRRYIDNGVRYTGKGIKADFLPHPVTAQYPRMCLDEYNHPANRMQGQCAIIGVYIEFLKNASDFIREKYKTMPLVPSGPIKRPVPPSVQTTQNKITTEFLTTRYLTPPERVSKHFSLMFGGIFKPMKINPVVEGQEEEGPQKKKSKKKKYDLGRTMYVIVSSANPSTAICPIHGVVHSKGIKTFFSYKEKRIGLYRAYCHSKKPAHSPFFQNGFKTFSLEPEATSTSCDKEEYFPSEKYIEETLTRMRDGGVSIQTINERYIGDIVSDLVTSEGMEMIFIKSPTGTGKTQSIRALNQKMGISNTSMLAVSTRVTSAGHLSDVLDCHNYSLQEESMNLPLYNRLVVSMESLHKLVEEGNKIRGYDVIVLDEIQTILQTFNSSTMSGKRSNYKILKKLIQTSKLCIFMDGMMGPKTFNWAMECRFFHNKRAVVLINDWSESTINHVIYRKSLYDAWMRVLYGYIACPSKKVCVISDSNSMLQGVIESLRVMYGRESFEKEVKYLIINGQSSRSVKDTSITCNQWSQYRLLAYTPAITVGNSYSPDDLDDVYDVVLVMYFGVVACDIIVQMMHRLRKLRDDTIHILVDERNKYYKPTIKTREEIDANIKDHRKSYEKEISDLIKKKLVVLPPICRKEKVTVKGIGLEKQAKTKEKVTKFQNAFHYMKNPDNPLRTIFIENIYDEINSKSLPVKYLIDQLEQNKSKWILLQDLEGHTEGIFELMVQKDNAKAKKYCAEEEDEDKDKDKDEERARPLIRDTAKRSQLNFIDKVCDMSSSVDGFSEAPDRQIEDVYVDLKGIIPHHSYVDMTYPLVEALSCPPEDPSFPSLFMKEYNRMRSDSAEIADIPVSMFVRFINGLGLCKFEDGQISYKPTIDYFEKEDFMASLDCKALLSKFEILCKAYPKFSYNKPSEEESSRNIFRYIMFDMCPRFGIYIENITPKTKGKHDDIIVGIQKARYTNMVDEDGKKKRKKENNIIGVFDIKKTVYSFLISLHSRREQAKKTGVYEKMMPSLLKLVDKSTCPPFLRALVDQLLLEEGASEGTQQLDTVDHPVDPSTSFDLIVD